MNDLGHLPTYLPTHKQYKQTSRTCIYQADILPFHHLIHVPTSPCNYYSTPFYHQHKKKRKRLHPHSQAPKPGTGRTSLIRSYSLTLTLTLPIPPHPSYPIRAIPLHSAHTHAHLVHASTCSEVAVPELPCLPYRTGIWANADAAEMRCGWRWGGDVRSACMKGRSCDCSERTRTYPRSGHATSSGMIGMTCFFPVFSYSS